MSYSSFLSHSCAISYPLFCSLTPLQAPTPHSKGGCSAGGSETQHQVLPGAARCPRKWCNGQNGWNISRKSVELWLGGWFKQLYLHRLRFRAHPPLKKWLSTSRELIMAQPMVQSVPRGLTWAVEKTRTISSVSSTFFDKSYDHPGK